MSEPPNTQAATTTTVDPHQPHHIQHHQHLPLIGRASTSTSTSHLREYRKGNWTLEETLVLITAKKLDEERRSKASSPSPSTIRATGGELRWKWVENYCCNNGCLRTQNQCNDKWDNLLRDYKKVREYELRSSSQSNLASYWAMDKQQRKDQNLPSNMSHQIYESLKDVVQKRYPSSQPPPIITSPPLTIQPPPPLPPPAVALPEISEASESSETETSGRVGADPKRRRVRDIGSSIVRGASVLAKTLRSREEKKEKREREMMELQERRMRVEETRNELNRQGMASLVAAVNNLSGAIQSLISDPHDHT